VANTRNEYRDASATRERVLAGLGIASLLVGSLALLLVLFTTTRSVAWVPAVSAISCSAACRALFGQTNGFASAGMLLGGLALVCSFATVMLVR
jgi:hypothetical protein